MQGRERIRGIYRPPLDKAGVLCYHIKAEVFSVCANMAQVVEQLTRNEQVEGSSPSIGSLLLSACSKEKAVCADDLFAIEV